MTGQEEHFDEGSRTRLCKLSRCQTLLYLLSITGLDSQRRDISTLIRSQLTFVRLIVAGLADGVQDRVVALSIHRPCAAFLIDWRGFNPAQGAGKCLQVCGFRCC